MTPAIYTPSQTLVSVIQDGEERAYVKFPDNRVLWVKSGDLDFETDGDFPEPDDWQDDDLDTALDSPTDWDEYEMNPDDSAPDAGSQYDVEYDT